MAVKVNADSISSSAALLCHRLCVRAAHSGAAEDPGLEFFVLQDDVQDGFADAAEEVAGFCVGESVVVQTGADVVEWILRVRQVVFETGVLGIIGGVFGGGFRRALASWDGFHC